MEKKFSLWNKIRKKRGNKINMVINISRLYESNTE